MKKICSKKDEAPAQLIDAKIEEPADWRGKMLSRLRALIKQADPEMIEERKWRKPSNAMAGMKGANERCLPPFWKGACHLFEGNPLI